MKIPKMFGKLYLYHFLAIAGSLVLFLPLNFTWNIPILFSAITTLLYTTIIYSTSWNFGHKDSRNIQDFKPNNKKIYCTATVFVILPLILLVAIYAIPNIFSIDFIQNISSSDFYAQTQGSIIDRIVDNNNFILRGNIITTFSELVYKIYFFPFEAFLGNCNIALYILPIIYCWIITVLGYIFGTKRKKFISPVFESLTMKIKYKKNTD